MEKGIGKCVAAWEIGQTDIYFYDGHLAKTEEEKKKVMENIRRATMAILEEEVEKKLQD